MSSCAALAVYSSYTAPPEIYSLSLHDALPILTNASAVFPPPPPPPWPFPFPGPGLGLGEGDGLGLGLGPTPTTRVTDEPSLTLVPPTGLMLSTIPDLSECLTG